MPLDLSSVQRFLEDQMIDTIRVTSDPEGVLDDSFDETTMEYFRAPGDLITRYEGKALIINQMQRRRTAPDEEGGRRIDRSLYSLRVPLSTDPFMINDRVEVIASGGTSNTTGLVLFVSNEIVTTLTASRLYQMERKIPAVPGGNMQEQ